MFSEKQLEILKFGYGDGKALICDGAVRSGKTMCMALSFITSSFKWFTGTNFGICGKTVSSCVKNIINPILSLSFFKKHYKLKFNRGSNILEVSLGNKKNYFYVYGGKDAGSYTLIQGITFGGVMLDEVALLHPTFVTQAIARCSLPGAKLWFNCNPESPSHWFYKEWILQAKEKKAIRLHFLMTDNPSLTQETLDDYETRFQGAFYRRYILGEWVKAEGLVYPMFDPDKHIIEEYDKRGQYFISIDYGTLNPCVFLLWRVNYNFRECPIVCVKEYYHTGRGDSGQKTDNQYYEDLEQFAKGYRVEKVIIDPSAASFKVLIRQKGKFSVRDANNDVLDGLRFTGTLLQDGYIKFDRSCKNTFAEFGSYVWDEQSETDKVIKENDHCMDALRYMMYTIIRKDGIYENEELLF